MQLIEKLSDAMSLVVEAQRDALRGDADAAMRQAMGAKMILEAMTKDITA